MIRIAGTGRYKKYIGTKLKEGCSYDYVLKSKRAESIINKKISKRCSNCNNLKECEEIATIGYPILSPKKEVLGVIGFTAFNQKQQEYINNNFNNINVFLKKVSLLLAGNIIYEEDSKDFLLKTKELKNVIDLLEDGCIIINQHGEIKLFNQKSLFLLKCGKKDILFKNINDIFSGFYIAENLKEEILVISKLDHLHKRFTIKVIENRINKALKTYLLKISKYEDIIKNSFSNLKHKKSITLDEFPMNSVAMKNLIFQLKQLSISNLPILLKGEFGVEFDEFARAIHNNSTKKKGRFITVDFKNIDIKEIEKYLFGIEKMNNLGEKISVKVGLFELANKGTIYFQEISRIPIGIQEKILTTIKTKKIRRLGGNKDIELNFNIISSTSENLEELLNKNNFLIELYYNLNVVSVRIPELRKRKEDILEIIENKIKNYSIILNKNTILLDEEIKKIFLSAYWKGNIIELENVIKYLIVTSKSENVGKNNLPEEFFINNNFYKENSKNFNLENILRENHTFEELTENFEKAILNFCLNKYGESTKSKEKIARMLNINLSTLYRKLYRYGLR